MIKVLNTCRQKAVDGPAKSSEGKAKIVQGSGNAKLKVSFFGPFYGDYWILDHAGDYSWSIVGEPSGKYVWLLHRKPVIEREEMKQLRSRIQSLGYHLRLLRYTQQQQK